LGEEIAVSYGPKSEGKIGATACTLKHFKNESLICLSFMPLWDRWDLNPHHCGDISRNFPSFFFCLGLIFNPQILSSILNNELMLMLVRRMRA